MNKSGKEEYHKRQRSSQLLMHNVAMLKEYMAISKKFTFEGYKKFLVKKVDDEKRTDKMLDPEKKVEKKNEKLEMNMAIVSFLENDNKEFKKVLLAQRQKFVMEMLQVNAPRYDRFIWALSQLENLNCKLEGNSLTVTGSTSTETGTFTIKTYDLTPHMKLIEKQEKFEKQFKGKEKNVGQTLVEIISKAINGDPKMNLLGLKGDLKLLDCRQSRIIDIDPSKIFNVLYNLQGAYAVQVKEEKAGVKSVINEDLEVNR